MDELTIADLTCLIESAKRLELINVENTDDFRETVAEMTDYQISNILRAVSAIRLTCRGLGQIKVKIERASEA